MNDAEAALPNDGPEREVLLVALARMSELCEPPNLIQECPFSVDLPAGGRGCGAECEVVLAAELSPRRTDLILGESGLAARQRPNLGANRSKKTLDHERAFDAKETYYRDSSTLPVRRWSTVALMVALKEIGLADPDERKPGAEDILGDCVAELVRRGFDVDTHLRPYFAQRMALAITATVAGVTALGRPPKASSVVERLIAWRDSMRRFEVPERPVAGTELVPQGFRLSPDLRQMLEFTLIGDFAKHVQEQTRASSIWELFAWDIGPEMRHDPFPHAPADSEQDQQNVAIWLFDRFTETYLREWSKESLRMEWRHRVGLIRRPVPEDQMHFRRVDDLTLASCLADLAVSNDERESRHDHLTKTAVRLLAAGERGAAAALFDTAREFDWSDALIQNNYGFCVLPDDPEVALVALEYAGSTGLHTTVNTANRMLALHWLGREAAALVIAENAMEHWDDLDSHPSWLWDFTGNRSQTTLLDGVCPRCYLVRLAGAVAEASGDTTEVERWGRRLAKLTHA